VVPASALSEDLPLEEALGWPVHELKIREEEGRVVFTL